MKDTSQWNQIKYIVSLFGGIEEVKSNKRYAIEVGAFDGVTNSNAHPLFSCGWEGISIEPDPISFEKLKDVYKNNDNVKCYSLCIHDNESGIVDFYGVNENLQYNDRQLCTLDKKFSDDINNERRVTASVYKKMAYPLHIFYEEFVNINVVDKLVDYITIDCECLDEKILLYNNFSIFRPTVIQSEFQYDNKIENIGMENRAIDHLKFNNYSVYKLPNSSDILAINDLNDKYLDLSILSELYKY